MSQVNLLSVEVSQSHDKQGGNANPSIKSQAQFGAFSAAMEQHYPKQKVPEADGEIKQNGKLVSKAATKQDDAHILPVPLAPDDESLPIKLKASDDAYILPVPLAPENEPLPVKLKASDDAYILPVPLTPENEPLPVKLKASDDAYILPVPLAPENEPLPVKLKASDDAYTLPVPVSPTRNNQELEQEQEASKGEADNALAWLKMLNGVDKVLTKASNGQNTESAIAVKNPLNPLAIEKNAVNDLAATSSQALTAEESLALAEKQNALLNQNNNELKANHEQQSLKDQKASSALLSAENKLATGEGHELKEIKKQSADGSQFSGTKFNRINDNEASQTAAINQRTASVVNASTIAPKVDTKQAIAMNAEITNADNSASEGETLAKTASEKLPVQTEKLAASFQQTLNAQAATPTQLKPSSGELAAQQAQSFDHAISQQTSNTVPAQKSITAINTETIAIYRKDFANAVKDKVMVMINQKIQQVEIQLDPPEMGNIHVRLNLQNEQAAVQFVVQNQQAKDALEQNIGKLRDMLAENGVDVGDANVEQQEKEQNDHGFERQANHGPNGELTEGSTTENDHAVLNVFKASSTGVDHYA